MRSVATTGGFGPAAPPYFLITSPGDWIVELRDGDTVIGRAVLSVRGQ